MLRLYNYDIVFQEIPDETTLALNLSGCPNRCSGCHSPWLWEESGEYLTPQGLDRLLAEYGSRITCVAFMGGDNDTQAVAALAHHLRTHWGSLKIGWYSGRDTLPPALRVTLFDFLKLGPYLAARGGLRSPTTNQRLYRIQPDGAMLPIRFAPRNGA
ncbi:MAG: anaerobic ribonucleoside-triphosphate reductase activating protein [Alistipes sp.]|nr:anaerobic ribonucleoside-triphosphate reductase activating protein [Alistipes sp.]